MRTARGTVLLGCAFTAVLVAATPANAAVAAVSHTAAPSGDVASRPAQALVRYADADTLYTFNNDLAFEQANQRYRSNDGYVTNFGSELAPLVPFADDGNLYLQRRDVVTPGSNYRLQDGQTSIQLNFDF